MIDELKTIAAPAPSWRTRVSALVLLLLGAVAAFDAYRVWQQLF